MLPARSERDSKNIIIIKRLIEVSQNLTSQKFYVMGVMMQKHTNNGAVLFSALCSTVMRI